jgi:hypothetical protein
VTPRRELILSERRRTELRRVIDATLRPRTPLSHDRLGMAVEALVDALQADELNRASRPAAAPDAATRRTLLHSAVAGALFGHLHNDRAVDDAAAAVIDELERLIPYADEQLLVGGDHDPNRAHKDRPSVQIIADAILQRTNGITRSVALVIGIAAVQALLDRRRLEAESGTAPYRAGNPYLSGSINHERYNAGLPMFPAPNTSSRSLLERAVAGAENTPDQWAPHVWSQLAAAAVAVERGEREAELHPLVVEVQRRFTSPPPERHTEKPLVPVDDPETAAAILVSAEQFAPAWVVALVDAAAGDGPLDFAGQPIPAWVRERLEDGVAAGRLGVAPAPTFGDGNGACSCPTPIGRNPECVVHGDDACTCASLPLDAGDAPAHDDGNPACPRNHR